MKITIIGTGAYGTALANVLADNNHDVVMYGVDKNQVNDINIKHKNTIFFNDILINNKIKATSDMPAALENTEVLIIGVPSFAIKSVIEDIKKYAKNEMVFINTTKGLDESNLDLLSKHIVSELKDSGIMKAFLGLYGPSIAIEVLERKPTALMLVGDDLEVANTYCGLFNNEYFSVYPSNDLAGSEIGAALKNTIAIAAGIFYEFGAGDNAQASLITAGLNEMINISKVYGASVNTFLNFAGLGDLILTASSQQSRNFRLGREIAKQGSAKKAMEVFKLTVEGVKSAEIAYKICEKFEINAPLFSNMYEILYNDIRPITLLNNVLKGVKLV
ncbi:NAD(P)H-dependent glycerol-3-phosphate dehydrogenase [Mesoplasma photuris]|uniref:NAD(P)H-dependent glycerol-3-phosphate dehydrogenase n=1 Tax=Mesoplasma photuris TaxID=217731 RepID=UPI0004E152DD|nr:NAD(P)H-dependent glycerol-3-phosphate dehydrogenase [Mesoplasma photuris]